jgi:hypothetical protein
MKRALVTVSRVALIAFVMSATAFGAIKHSFVAIDEGLNNLLYVNENDSAANWIVSIGRSAPRDMQLVGNNRILIGHNNGYSEYDLTTGSVKRQLLSYDSVSSVRRLPNGQTLIVGVDLAGSKGVVMLRLDSNNVQIKKTVYPGTYVRLARQTKTGTFLMACNDTIKEADTGGSFILKAHIQYAAYPANKHMWKAVRLDNGNILLSGGYGAFMAEVNSLGTIVRKFGAAPQPAGVKPYFYGMFQLLPNGDCVVANWQGHGAGHDTAGKVLELLEFDPAGAIVWSWNKPALISSLQGVLVLDSLNTNLLYDDRNGLMAPVSPPTQVNAPFLRGFSRPDQADDNPSHTVSGSYRVRVIDLLGRCIGVPKGHLTGGKTADAGAGLFIVKLKNDNRPEKYPLP